MVSKVIRVLLFVLVAPGVYGVAEEDRSMGPGVTKLWEATNALSENGEGPGVTKLWEATNALSENGEVRGVITLYDEEKRHCVRGYSFSYYQFSDGGETLTMYQCKEFDHIQDGIKDLVFDFEDLPRHLWEALAKALPDTLQTLSLNLGSSNACDAGIEVLAKALPDTLQTLSLDLSDADVGDAGIEVLAKALPDTLQTLSLDLSSSDVGDAGIEALAKALPNTLQTLTLDLSAKDVGDAGIEALAKALPDTLQLLYLRLWNTDVGDAGIEVLAKALPDTLQTLSLGLSNTDVGDAGIEAIAKALPDTVQTLTLALDARIEVLAKALPDTVHTLTLDPPRTHAAVAEIKALPDTVQTLTLILSYTHVRVADMEVPDTVQTLTLDLSGTNLGDAEIKALPDTLQNLSLDFSWSHVGDAGIEVLAKALPDTLQTLSLDLSWSNVGDDGIEALAKRASDGLKTLKLQLSDTNVGDAGLEAMSQIANIDLRMSTRSSRVSDRGLRAFCTPCPKGKVHLDTRSSWVSPIEAKECSNRCGSNTELSIQWGDGGNPWPDKVEDILHAGRTAPDQLEGFNCSWWDFHWSVALDAEDQSLYEKVQIFKSGDDALRRCLEEVGYNPTQLDQVVSALQSPDFWFAIIAAIICAGIASICRVRMNPGRCSSSCTPHTKSREDVLARPVEILSTTLPFFGFFAQFWPHEVSLVVFVVCFCIPATCEHGITKIMKAPTFVFANRKLVWRAMAAVRSLLIVGITFYFLSLDLEGGSPPLVAKLVEIFHPKAIQMRNFVNDCESYPEEHIKVPFIDLGISLRKVDVVVSYDMMMMFIGAILQPCIVLRLLVEYCCSANDQDRETSPSEASEAAKTAGVDPEVPSEQTHQIHEYNENNDTAALMGTSGSTTQNIDYVKVAQGLWKQKDVGLFVLDILTDANTLFSMLGNRQFKFFFAMLTVWLTSVFEEAMIGDVFLLPKEAGPALAKGKAPAAFRRMSARERSFEACLSLAITAYSFRYVFHTATQMMGGILSILLSCKAAGSYVHEVFDLARDDTECRDIDAE